MLWAKHIFRCGFETTFGVLLGRYGCPFVYVPQRSSKDMRANLDMIRNDPSSEISEPLSTLVGRLDTEHEAHAPERISAPGLLAPATDDLIEECLDRAILAFTARWLPSKVLAVENRDEVTSNTWRDSRSAMLMLLNRISYRSVLALYLFAQTPVPAGISEQEELSGVSASVSMHTALVQIQKLRQRCDPGTPHPTFSYNSEQDSLVRGTAVKKAQAPVTQIFLNLESRAYWAGVMWDTSDALYSEMRTSITSGLNGACAEPAWRLSRAFLVGLFAASTASLHTNANSSSVIDDPQASRILGGASISQVLMWKNVTSIKEALREGVDEDTVSWVWDSLMETIRIFRELIRPLLQRCERQIHFLSQTNRFCWFEVSIRYCVGVGILLDALEKAKRSRLLDALVQVRDEVEHEAFAVLKFGIDNVYRIPARDTVLEPGAPVGFPIEPVEMSFVIMYAFPNHIVTLAQTMCRVLTRRFRKEGLDGSVFDHLCAVLSTSLEQLPQNFKGLSAARRDLEISINVAIL
jgi:hypothetical protein